MEINETIKKEIIDYINSNQPELYWNYSSELSSEQIANILKSEDTALEVENDIYESNIDYISDLESDLAKDIISKFELDATVEDVLDEFRDYISIDLNLHVLLKNSWTYITLNTGIYIGDSAYGKLDYDDLKEALDFLNINPINVAKLIKKGYGYSSMKEELKDKDISNFPDIREREGEEIVSPEEFVEDLANNSYGGELIFQMDINLVDFYDNRDKYTNDFILKSGANGTIHNYGVGACGVGFKTKKDLLIPSSMKTSFKVDEEMGYGIQETAGLTKQVWNGKVEEYKKMRMGGNTGLYIVGYITPKGGKKKRIFQDRHPAVVFGKNLSLQGEEGVTLNVLDNSVLKKLGYFKNGGYIEQGIYKDGGNVDGKKLISGKYLQLESTPNGNLRIVITEEGREYVKEYHDGDDDDIFSEMFEDIQVNSEYDFFSDLGSASLGMSEAPAITDGFYMDDDGNITDEGHDDSEVYWFPNYMVENYFEELLENGSVIFTKSNKMKTGGTMDNTPKIYVADLAAYNEGKLVGEWVDISDFSSGEEVLEHITELMEKWSKEQGVEREEYAVHDYENFPEYLYSEYMGEDDFQEVVDYWKAIQDAEYPIEVIEEYMDNRGIKDFSDAIRSMSNAQLGTYEDIEDFARQWIDMGGVPDHSHFYVSNTDRRIIANEEADRTVDDMSDRELVERANMEDEYEKAEYEDDDDRMSEIVDEAREKVHDEVYEEWYDGLEDPYDFLVNEHGLYDEQSFVSASFVQVDYKALGEELSSDYYVIEHDGDVYVFDSNYRKGGNVKQNKPQYKRKDYGSQDRKRLAKPAGFRYKKVEGKNGRLRAVTKDDKEYYRTPTKKLIKAYEDKENDMHKKARKMIYFENRADHSDKEPLRTLRKYMSGGSVTIGDHKARYKVKYKLNEGDSMKDGFLVEIIDGSDVKYILYTKGKKLVKELTSEEGIKLVKDGFIQKIKDYGTSIVDEEVEKDITKMSYAQRGEFINSEILPYIESAELYWNAYDGDSYDYKDAKQEEKYLQDCINEADYKNTEEFEEKTGLKVVDGWYIEDENGDVEELASDNTYNWGYLGLITWNFRVYGHGDKYYLIAHPHRGGDVRGNYGEPIFFVGDSEESVLYDFREKVINGHRAILIRFTDGSKLSYYAQQDSDVDYFELSNEVKEGTKAFFVNELFDKFGKWYGDDFLVSITDEFDSNKKSGGTLKQNKPQYKRKDYGSQDKKRLAKPSGYRYKKVAGTFGLRTVTKDDKEYYRTPTKKLIKAYEDKENDMHKKARKMIYFENRADHSDKQPKNLRKYRDGGGITYSLIEASDPDFGVVIDTGWTVEDFRAYLDVRKESNPTAKIYPDSSEVGFFIGDDTGTCWGLVSSDYKIGDKYYLPKN